MHDVMNVDGLAVPVRAGDTILSACRRAGLTIPTLCYHAGLEPYGACRLCVVEVRRDHQGPPATPVDPDPSAAPRPAASSGAASGRVVASCTTPAQPDLHVLTTSTRVARVRRAVVTFLLERCPRSEILLQLAEDLSVPLPPGAPPRPAATSAAAAAHVLSASVTAPGAAPPTSAGVAPPHVEPARGVPGLPPVPPELDEMCVLCGRCVQACEKLGHFAIGFAGRSIARRVTPPFGVSSETCTACGACAEVCPTGAVRLLVESRAHAVEAEGGRPRVATSTAHLPAWRTTVPLYTCRSCGRPLWSDSLIPSAPAGMADLCPTCRRKQALALVSSTSRQRGDALGVKFHADSPHP